MNSQAVIATVLCLLAAGAVSAQTGKKANRSSLGQVMPDYEERREALRRLGPSMLW